MPVDPTKARELLDRAIELANDGDPDDFNEWRESARVALRVALGEDDPTLARFDQISYSPIMFSAGTPEAVFDDARRGGVRRATAMLAAVLTEVDVSQPSAPGVDVQALDPWVAGLAASFAPSRRATAGRSSNGSRSSPRASTTDLHDLVSALLVS